MIKTLLSCLLITISLHCFSQNPGGAAQEKTILEFSYDNSGNQIKKEMKDIIFYPNPFTDDQESFDDIDDCFVVYPSPTSGPLTLDWSRDGCGIYWEATHGVIKQITLSDFKAVTETIPFNSNQTTINTDLSGKLEGIYIIRFVLSDGYTITKKVQKYNP